jgi:argininosuccinate synthase
MNTPEADVERIVLAYDGGLDTTAAIPWLMDRHGAEVVTVTMDLGAGHELEGVRDRALAAGALRAHVLDLREQFAQDFILAALKADALFDDRSPMTAALSRPLIASQLVEIASIERADAVAHGGASHGKRGALDVLIRALAPRLRILAPAREWAMREADVAVYAARLGIGAPAAEGPFRIDANLWGRSIECADLDDEPPEALYTLTRPARECPDEPAYVDLTFTRGTPTAINGVTMPLIELIGSLGTIASTHGVGRIDVVEHRVGRSRLREVGEAPAAVVLHVAHKELGKVSASRELERFGRTVSAEYAEVIYEGLWFSPLRKALAAYVDAVQARVSGVVRLRLFKGGYTVVGRRAQPARKPAIIPVTRSS